MKFRYVGDDDSPPSRTVVCGYAFALHGDPVVVMDPEVQRKLAGNRCFAEVKRGRPRGARKAEDGIDEG